MLNMITIWPVILLLCTQAKKTENLCPHKNPHTNVHSIINDKKQKQHKCPPTNEQLKHGTSTRWNIILQQKSEYTTLLYYVP